MMSEEITGCKTGGRNHRKQTTLNEDPCPGSNRERACRRASRSIHRLRPARTGGRGQRRFSQIGGRVAPHGRRRPDGPLGQQIVHFVEETDGAAGYAFQPTGATVGQFTLCQFTLCQFAMGQFMLCRGGRRNRGWVAAARTLANRPDLATGDFEQLSALRASKMNRHGSRIPAANKGGGLESRSPRRGEKQARFILG